MQFDLDVVDTRKRSEEGVELVIVGGDGLPVQIRGEPLAITFAGPDSARYAEGLRRAQKRQRDAAERRQELGEGEFQAIVLAECAISWKGVFTPDQGKDKGKPVPCSREAALALFQQYPWIAFQAERFTGVRANFLPKSSPA
jgi:hypothetical protein